MWQDEQVVNFDAQERLKPYTYYTLIDTDEYITMKNSTTTTFVQLMVIYLTLSPPITTIVPYANSLDPGETPRNSASHPDPSCLTLGEHFH